MKIKLIRRKKNNIKYKKLKVFIKIKNEYKNIKINFLIRISFIIKFHFWAE